MRRTVPLVVAAAVVVAVVAGAVSAFLASGPSGAVLRNTYVHFNLDTADWAHIKTLGAQRRAIDAG